MAGVIFVFVSVEGKPLDQVMVLGFLLYRLMMRLIDLQGQLQRFNGTIGGLIAVEEHLKKLRAGEEINGDLQLARLDQAISFQSVSLNINKKPIIKNITFCIPRNSFVGIAGISGSGKTSFLKLLLGLYKPTSGLIHLGGYELSKLDIKSVRKRVGYLSQDPVMLNESLLNNIVLWQATADESTKQKVVEVMRKSGCEHLVRDLDRKIGEGGKGLSGGERQRLALARELFREPHLIILDEPTSALDAVSEKLVMESILQACKDRMTFLVAHKIENLKHCDTVLVFENGCIVEQGGYFGVNHQIEWCLAINV